MKNFGFSGINNVIYIGTNGKMNEVSAAMGLTSSTYLISQESSLEPMMNVKGKPTNTSFWK